MKFKKIALSRITQAFQFFPSNYSLKLYWYFYLECTAAEQAKECAWVGVRIFLWRHCWICSSPQWLMRDHVTSKPLLILGVCQPSSTQDFYPRQCHLPSLLSSYPLVPQTPSRQINDASEDTLLWGILGFWGPFITSSHGRYGREVPWHPQVFEHTQEYQQLLEGRILYFREMTWCPSERKKNRQWWLLPLELY